ncbi:FUSC family protein [Castellaniella sp.]|uniref:FUSC family protein n=1 Tax=Castellaniella sp. TaxID=1955812 RepID=UPI002AFF2BF9|nr:FUSC family protein [Castellaniella sp.]
MAETPMPRDPGNSNLPMRRRDAVRHLLHARRFEESVKLGTPPPVRNSALAGLQAALATALCVPLFLLSPWAHLVGFASLGALVALFGRFAPRRSRTGIVLQCAFWQTFGVFAMSATAWLGWPRAAQLALLAASCGFYLLISFRNRFGAPGPLIFIFAVGASMTDTLDLAQVAERSLATAIAAALAWLICVASETLRHPPTPERPFPRDPERSPSELRFMAARVAIATLIVVFASHALGLSHPAWAAMGAVAVMQGSHLHVSMHRALQRMAGTMVGAAFAWLLLVQQPSAWLILAVLALLQILTEIVIGVNYGLAQVLVTPMALLMTHLAAPAAAGAALAPERVADTLLGALIGIVIAVALSSIEDRRMLAHHHQARLPG